MCERYDIRSGKHSEWAIIMLDERGGILQINSDFGNWSYNWPCHGRKSFKHFIAELGRDTEYLMGKLHGRKDQFNEAGTKKAITEIIVYYRKDATLNKADARTAFNAVQEADWSCASDVLQTVGEFPNRVRDLFDDGPPIDCDWPSSLRLFIERLWPVFVEAIKGEIAICQQQ